MTAAELRRRHPHAVRVRGGYCLDRRYTSGPGEQVGGAICAELRNGRLAAFHVGLAYP
jgi:hypothetical protein